MKKLELFVFGFCCMGAGICFHKADYISMVFCLLFPILCLFTNTDKEE